MTLPDLELIRKYTRPGPRYTSYPTAVQFRELENLQEIDPDLAEAGGESRRLSIYIHIPFCFSLCWYCGCTKVITRKSDRGDAYLDYLEREMDLLLERTGPSPVAVQIHWGGGTPTFLKPDQLMRLGEAIRKRFRMDPEVEFSVEIDPRHCSREQADVLREIGCNRASLGVQDTDPEVQKAIHRIQPFEQTAEVTRLLREAGIGQINHDLIYGLPLQTPEGFQRTLEQVLTLDPDRLAVYSYAHLPRLMPSQRLLDEATLPPADSKLEMLRGAIDYLTSHGMRFIGMDHFAREGDSLTRALDAGTLHRNFQGYSTHAETDLIAFGMSGISKLENLYFQNTKELSDYYRMLDEGRMPVVRGVRLDRDDRIRQDLIMQIMCRGTVDFRTFSARWEIDFQDYFSEELSRLDEQEADGLLLRRTDALEITATGRLFLRNIAMVFDRYLEQARKQIRFSSTV